MQLNDSTDYGLRILMLLGHAAPQRVPNRNMASIHGLSYSHLQKVTQSLEAAGFVETRRGRGGGARLAREPEEIRIGDVVRALEPHLGLVRCLRPGVSGCVLDGGCGLAGVLRRAAEAFMGELDGTTLADVLEASPFADRLALEAAS